MERWSVRFTIKVYKGSNKISFRYHGYGELIRVDFSYIKGNWNLGKKHGSVEELLRNGERYNGEYANGLRHGYGKIT